MTPVDLDFAIAATVAMTPIPDEMVRAKFARFLDFNNPEDRTAYLEARAEIARELLNIALRIQCTK